MSRLTFWLLLLALASSAAAGEAKRLVVIDPGHGGRREGAVGPSGLREKTLALALAKRVAALGRRELGFEFLLTRTTDREVPLAERVAFANRRHADLFLSIHANSMPTARSRRATRGIETYFLSADPSGAAAAALAARENRDDRARSRKRSAGDVDAILDDLSLTAAHANSSRLAYALQQRLVQATRAADRGVQQAPFFVLTGAHMPAVLIEVGFVSQPEEERQLASPAYEDALAQAIVHGLSDYENAVAPKTAAR
ncbi:MAG: N-acetylmuramoyl-L-alanine amidase family protein [Deltaproteobacteria bacterium]